MRRVYSLALVAWAVVTRHLQDGVRRASLVAAILLAVAPFALIRTAGIRGAGSEFHWRWTPTPEQRLLAQADGELKALPPSAPLAETATETPEPARGEPAALAAAPTTAKTEAPAPSPMAPPAEWPGFRGPNRDDVIRGVRINTDWSASPPVEMWRRPIGPGWSSFAPTPTWGFSASPLVVDDVVIVAASGTLTAYDLASGHARRVNPSRGGTPAAEVESG
ncbi:MAG: hypothetical protein HY701_05680 [Gemmatimonadetes bacterium]|nr:hypothetical protein [Gemmatimonadota bacterium]